MGFGDSGASERRRARERERKAELKQEAEDQLKKAQDEIASATVKEKDALANKDAGTYAADEDPLEDVKPINVGQLADDNSEYLLRYGVRKKKMTGKTKKKKK